ncbi:hypothetical protein [Embleya sp. NPDC005971]|uniref:hypothetical protein n=1 Tax=Embleya sp. NPDC005971 TaxID=3156724 RepID=UPI0033E3A55F
MSYSISYDRRARQQAANLPRLAQSALSGAESRLASDPWGCTQAAGHLKEMRHMEFTAGGLITLTIQVQTSTVVIMDITYVG